MIDIEVPVGFIWLLRWLLFLGPLTALMILSARKKDDYRALVGTLFAFLYGVGTIFITHQIAIYFGWWRYGGNALMLNGLPVDIWLGGALLFGPVLSLAFPKTAPIYLVLPIILGLHGTVFLSLEPLVYAGRGWFFGTIFVFLIAHIPAIYLSRWTANDRLLPLRAALLAFGFGFLAFAVQPTIVMKAMGGSWALDTLSPLKLVIGLPFLAASFVMGLSAVQMFVVHGEGTPIPLDNTKRLVRTGIYAYITNPMQLCSALSWVAIGFIIGNIWVAASALMAWVFVLGMVRWHHRHDLLVRFPKGWPEYRDNVPEWRPLWKPWVPMPATLSYNPNESHQMKVIEFLRKRQALSLNYEAQNTERLSYCEPDEAQSFDGLAAIAKGLNHINFFWCLVGAAMLLVLLPVKYIRNMREHLRDEKRA